MSEKIIAHIDGGSRGNPGPAAAAFVLTDPQGRQLQARAFFIGEATNNVAEYTAIHKALEAAKSLGATQITVYSDSELLVRQLNGQYKVKSDQIRPLFAKSARDARPNSKAGRFGISSGRTTSRPICLSIAPWIPKVTLKLKPGAVKRQNRFGWEC